MYFWNVVLSYVRNQTSDNDAKSNANDIELDEHLAPNPAHSDIYKHKNNVPPKRNPKTRNVNPKHAQRRQDNIRRYDRYAQYSATQYNIV